MSASGRQSWSIQPTPCTLHPTPYTLHPTPYTPHPTPYTLPHTREGERGREKEKEGTAEARDELLWEAELVDVLDALLHCLLLQKEKRLYSPYDGSTPHTHHTSRPQQSDASGRRSWSTFSMLYCTASCSRFGPRLKVVGFHVLSLKFPV